ncbi:MAG: hypothetical protein ACYTGH_15125, partial [Planctomycetota bacterium]
MRIPTLLLLALLFGTMPAFLDVPLLRSQVLAMDLDDDDDDDEGGLLGGDDDDDLSLEEDGEADAGADLELLKGSHLSYVRSWVNAKPLRRPRKGYPQKTYHWAPSRAGGYAPLGKKPIHTFLKIPGDGTYRLYLRHVVDAKAKRPVTLTLTPQTATPMPVEKKANGKAVKTPGFSFADSGSAIKHVYGDLTFLAGVNGKKMEKKLPLRFESEPQLLGFHDRPTMVWEFWDVELKKGDYRVALQSNLRSVAASHLFLSQSKAFRPSFTTYGEESTFGRVWVRFRVKEGKVKGKDYDVNASLTYHWPGRKAKGSTESMWGYRLGSVDDAPAKGWSSFLDGTEAMVPGPGPWSTCRLNFYGIKKGKIEIQLAWYPHEGAVQHTATVNLDQGRAMLRLPHKNPWVPSQAKGSVWGMWPSHYVQ